jgi:hypothetical protein
MTQFLHGLGLYTMTMLLVILHQMSFGQQAPLDTLRKKFDRYRLNNPTEKLYVHTDQDLYLTGETLWFKIYYVDGALHQPGDISKVGYVEILDKDNRPVLQAKISLKNGQGNGALFLPATLNTGNYRLRAYTQWMKNFDPELFFYKTVNVVNTFRRLDEKKTPSAEEQQFHVQFFPEGGDLVAGLRSKVAFQITDSRGNGLNLPGMILNSQNDTIVSFTSQKFGIGNFIFTPQPGDSYRAVITSPTGRSGKFNLPASKEQGYVMEVRDSTTDFIAINIASSAPVNQSKAIYYFIHSRQVIATSGVHQWIGGKTSILVEKKNLNEGISHITIFDQYLNPVCERLFFKPVSKKLNLDIQASQSEYGVRRKVFINVSSDSDSTAFSGARLSVAVVKSDSLQNDLTGNIFNYLWLTSDLKGDVESPAFYADASSPEVRAALDNLMLTHGWRRFEWTDVLGNKKQSIKYLPEYRGHLIRGSILDEKDQPASGIGTYLSSPSKIIQLYTARSKANGEVQFEMKDFWGSKKVIVQTNTSQDSTYQIKLINPFSEEHTSTKLADFDLNPDVANNLLRRSIAMQVQDIYYGDHFINFSDGAIDSSAFYGKADQTYFLDDFTRFTVMEEVMREYVSGVMVRKRRDGFHFLVLNNVRKTLFQDDPLIMLDGMPIFDVDRIMAFDPLKIKKLEVFTGRYYLGPLHFPGLVSYSTYGGDLGGFTPDQKALSLNYEGLQRQRVFYLPQYETQKQRESRRPDRRHLLYWNPQVTLDADGKQQLEFFTSDLTGNYTIVVEGLNKNGYAGSKVSSLSVKQFNN